MNWIWARFLLAVCIFLQANAEEVGILESWAESAFQLVQDDCQNCNYKKSHFIVYAAKPTSKGRYKALVVDGSGRRSGKHDSILVLDPSPDTRFGHELHMFFIDRNHSLASCEKIRGTILKNGDCMQQWMRDMCHKRAPKRRGGCKLLYLPEARLEGSKLDSLECVSNLKIFSSNCPVLLSHRESSGCDPVETNSKSCDTTTYIKTNCAFMKTCDQAVMISGGWNRKMSDAQSMKNIKNMNKILQRNGFLQNNMRIFYANGLSLNEDKYEELGDVYPSSLKLAIRYHIRTLCETKRCADTIVLYLNSPALPDGSSLLWDVNGDGVYDETEIYTVKEFFRDIMGCKARRLIILLDQSYCGEIIRAALKHISFMTNVIILGVKVDDPRNSMVETLSNYGPSTCLSDIYNSTHDIKFRGTSPGLLNSTIFGAPCTQDVDYERFYGCQNLSTLEMLEPDQFYDSYEQR